MTLFRSILILLTALLAVFVETQVGFTERLLAVRIPLLPAVVVYGALRGGPGVLTATATLGGLGLDSLSANPLGLSVIPLLLAGLVMRHFESMLLRDLPYAQFMLGAAAAALLFVMSLGLLLTLHQEPVLGWATVWRGVVSSIGAGALTPLCFKVLDGVDHALNPQPALESSSFRKDREIKRGRT